MTEKRANLIFMMFSALCFIAIFVCLICNFAVDKSISWSLYVLFSVVFGWAALVPLFKAKKNKVFWKLVVITVLLVPYLFSLGMITPVKDWFGVLGLPCAAITIISFWVAYVVFKFLKINKWFKCSLLVFLFGGIATPLIDFLAASYTNDKFLTFDNILSFVTMMLLSGLLFYIGRGHHISAKAASAPAPEKPEESKE